MSNQSVPDDAIGCLVPHNITQPIRGSGNGPLAGKTLVIKDLYDTAGRKTGNGSPDFLAASEPATQTAATVQKLLDAGADIVGIAICDEFFYSLTGANADHRFAVRSADVAAVAALLAARLIPEATPSSDTTPQPAQKASPESLGFAQKAFDQIVHDLENHRGTSLVVAGRRQPADGHTHEPSA